MKIVANWPAQAVLVSLILFLFGNSLAEEDNTESLNCNVGPATKKFGGTEWQVYSCGDSTTLVFVSSPGNPAMPFYFMTTLEKGERTLKGEGTGSREATAAAYHDLSAFIVVEENVRGLILDTISAHENQSKPE